MANIVRRVLTLAASLGVLAGCTAPQATFVPDGRRGYVISCEGYLDNFGSCLVKAGHACGPAGYDVIRGGENDRNLLIACKAPK